MEMPKSMRNIGKYADNVMNVMRENAHIFISMACTYYAKVFKKSLQVYEIQSNFSDFWKKEKY
jgi:hypothetical protein